MRTTLMWLSCFLLPAPACAQTLFRTTEAGSGAPAFWRLGLAIGVMIPSGAFAHQAQAGGFGDVFVSRHASEFQSFGWRFDATFAEFSAVDRQTTVNVSGFGDLSATATQTAQVFAFTIGPEWIEPSGRARPYLRAGAGLSVVYANVSLVRGRFSSTLDSACTARGR